MKLTTVGDLKVGDKLAKDVLLEDYTVLLSKGTEITQAYIDRLNELSIITVYIEDEVQEEVAPEEENELKHSPEEITILKDDVEKKMANRVRDILEIHSYQEDDGLKKIGETAENIITDILQDDQVLDKVYDVRERSADIYEHSIVTCTTATIVALKLGLNQKEVYDVSVAALVHDIGLRYLKVRYEDQDINLLPKSDQEEYRKHPIYSYTSLKNESWITEEAKDIVLNHHERVDGTGYATGTDRLNRCSQILGLCDEFDEMICGIGKVRVRVHEAINTVRNYSGIWYDSDVVDTFLGIIAVYPVGTKVKTNQGETGEVIKQNAHFPERPVIRILKDANGNTLKEEKVVDLIKDTRVVIQEVIK